jgi:hypothetical protein
LKDKKDPCRIGKCTDDIIIATEGKYCKRQMENLDSYVSYDDISTVYFAAHPEENIRNQPKYQRGE